MQLKKTILAIMLTVFSGVLMTVPVKADYMISPPIEDYSVIPDHWTLLKSSLLGDFDRLQLIHKGKTYTWTIDRFLLADRTDSNTICTGSYMNFTKEYLEKLSRSQPNTPVRVEVVIEKKGGPLIIAGIWLVDFTQAWGRAIQQGSRVLNLSAEQVRNLKSPSGYERKLQELSEQQWNLLETRPLGAQVPHL